MPLSEQEQRLLDEMERHLMRNDADVVSAPRDGRTLSYRNIVYGTILVLLGLGGLVVGVSTQLIVVGVIGFVVMLGSAFYALTSYRRVAGGAQLGVVDGTGAPRPPKAAAKPAKDRRKLMERLEERWNRRRDENGR